MFQDEFAVKKGFLTGAVRIPKQSLMIHLLL